jgi:colanic acid/amylovoran biosynthesis glycosyltransferase
VPTDEAGARFIVMRLAYVLSRYPKVSHTFIWREIQELRSLGFEVETFSLWRTDPADLLSAPDRHAFETTQALRPPRPLAHLRAHLRALAAGPRAYLGCLKRALRLSTPGPRTRLSALVWFNEAIVVWNHCEQGGVEHVHAHFAGAPAAIASLVAGFSKRARGPGSWSFTVHGPVEFFDPLLGAKAEDAQLVICISDFARSQVMALVDESHWEKLRVVHCGVDIAAYDSRLEEIAATAKSGGGGEARSAAATRLLSVGRLVSLKGHAVLLQAVAEMRDAGQDMNLTIVGDGPRKAGLIEYGRSLGLVDAVEWTGALGQDELPLRYSEADVFCLPSFAEGVPTVLMEAMLTETPVVATRVAGVPELVEDGVTGLLVAPGRPQALAAAIARLAADPALRARMGSAGRAMVEAEFDCRDSARRLAEIFAAQPGA